MKLFFIMNTPADVHTWKHLIYALINEGNEIKIYARDYGCTLELLSKYGFQFQPFKSIRSKYFKFFELFTRIFVVLKPILKFNPDIILGFGADAASISALFRKKSIIFTDSEPVPFQNFLIKLFSSVIITPSCFKVDLGKRQVRVKGFKELAYLHPKYFHPDISIYNELGLSRTDKFILLRFNAFDALHDIGRYGFSLTDKYRLVGELEKHAKVFISSEVRLPPDLYKYQLPVSDERIHHVLYFAHLLVSDTQTMSTEAAVLGTPVVRCNTFVGSQDMGNFIELEEKYELIYNIKDSGSAIKKSLALIQELDLKRKWAEKRDKLLSEKIDVTQFMIDFIKELFSKYKVDRK